jgi:hypothetical protein
MLQALLAISIGIALAAAAGLRVFVPLLAAGSAGRLGYVELSPGFEWLATTPALVAIAVAMLVEIAAYLQPWLDNALDVIATPVAIGAGMLVSAAVLIDLPPLLKWAAVLIGGGGAAGLVQAISVSARFKSSALTAGIGNPLLSTVEAAGAALLSGIAIALPVVSLLLVIAGCAMLVRGAGRFLFGRRHGQ